MLVITLDNYLMNVTSIIDSLILFFYLTYYFNSLIYLLIFYFYRCFNYTL